MPRQVLITTATLVGLAALGGYWLGQRQVTPDASGIIRAVAEQHVVTHGGSVSDCVGWPVEGPTVLHVRCGTVTYGVDRFGGIAPVAEGDI